MSKQFAIGVKLIAFVAMTRDQYNGYRGWNTPPNENGKDEGYLVEYLGQGNSNHIAHENYISWTTKPVFEAAYLPIEDGTKISKNDVEKFIVQGQGTKLGEKTTVVLDSTITGFDTLGTSACVDPANYDQSIGEEIARRDITNKIWGHLGFVLQWAKTGLMSK